MCADSSEPSQLVIYVYFFTTNDAALLKQAWEVLKLNGEIYMELAPAFFANFMVSKIGSYKLDVYSYE